VSIVLDPPAQSARIARAEPRRFLGRSIDFWIIAGLVTVVVLVQAWNIADYPTVSDDEGTYLAQAWALQHGIGLAPYTYWYDHPPFGWMQIALMSWLPALIFHSHNLLVVGYARIIMLPVTAVSSILVYVLARRLTLPRWAAALAVVCFGLSPLSVTLQREVFLDNFAVVWLLAAFVLAYSPRKHLWHHVAAGVCAALACLSKETALIAVPALVVALWQNAHHATRKYSFVGFCGAFILVLIQYPLYAVLRGELFEGSGHVSLIGGVLYQMERPGSGSIFATNSDGFSIFHSWLYYDPILIFAGVAATLIALTFRHLRPVAIAAVLLTLVAMRPSGYLPAMYVIQVLPFFALAIAGIADRIVALLTTYRARPILWERVARFAVVAVVAAAAAFYVVPRWYAGDKTADTADANAGYQAAATWVAEHIKPTKVVDGKVQDTRIVVDDGLWLNMEEDGFNGSHYDIYFFKINLDPAVMAALGGSGQPTADKWEDLGYIVSTPYLRLNASSLPTLKTALLPQHNRVLWSYGSGANEIQVLQVLPGS
jgi:4-amino-4-deoxy-L-arabinose transferase-like glycosyltransferase